MHMGEVREWDVAKPLWLHPYFLAMPPPTPLSVLLPRTDVHIFGTSRLVPPRRFLADFVRYMSTLFPGLSDKGAYSHKAVYVHAPPRTSSVPAGRA